METSEPRRERERRRGRDVLTALILLIAVSAMGMVAYGQVAAARVSRSQAELAPVADGVANRVGTAHLYLVQALGGDASVDVGDDVFAPLAEALQLAQAALAGGSATPGEARRPTTDPVVTADLRLLAAQVDSFASQAGSRWMHREGAGQIGTRADQEFDRIYATIIAQTDKLSRDIALTEDRARHRIQVVNTAVLGILAVFFVGVATFARHTRRAIVAKNEELETRVVERTTELARSEARTAAIVDTARDAIITVDEAGLIRSVNPAAQRMFDYASDELLGAHAAILLAEDDRYPRDGHLRRFLEAGARDVVGLGRETVGRRRDGGLFPIDVSVSQARVGEDPIFVGVIRDITQSKRVEAELRAAKAVAEEAATHDALTGLWNHNRIIEVLMEELARSGRQSSPLSIAMVDLDHFKDINDTYGHVVGDEVLREIALRLRRSIRAYDAVGRFGGEEFMVVLPGAEGATAEAAAERIRTRINREHVLTTAGTLQVTASLGLVTSVGDLVHDATALLVAADTAMYSAKVAGRDRVSTGAMR
jgi:diguanylate cyclase (GGDEF)-like protein/PAS domain S-box-containing protein